MSDRERSRGRTGRDAELAEDVLHVPRDRVLADDEVHRDLPIAASRCQQAST